MKDLNQYLNYAFEFYNHEGNIIDKFDGPGDLGSWLFDPEAPMEIAIYPVPYEKAEGHIEGKLLRKAVRIQLDQDGNELIANREDLIAFEPGDLREAKQMAKDLGCEYYYWISWDLTRIMVILNTESPEAFHKDPNTVYYFHQYGED